MHLVVLGLLVDQVLSNQERLDHLDLVVLALWVAFPALAHEDLLQEVLLVVEAAQAVGALAAVVVVVLVAFVAVVEGQVASVAVEVQVAFVAVAEGQVVSAAVVEGQVA